MLVYVDGLYLVAETDLSYGVVIDPDDKDAYAWLPKSQLESVDLEEGIEGSAVMPEWLADKYDFEFEDYAHDPDDDSWGFVD